MRTFLLALSLVLGSAFAQDAPPEAPSPPAEATPADDAPRDADGTPPAQDAEGAPDASTPDQPDAPESDRGSSQTADEPPPSTPSEVPVAPMAPFIPEPLIEPGDPAFMGPARVSAPQLSFGPVPAGDPLVERTPPADESLVPPDEPPVLPATVPVPDAPAATAPSDAPAPQTTLGVLESLSAASRALVPRIVLRGFGWALVLSLLGGLCWLLARGVQPVRDRLAPAGVLPAFASGIQHTLRIVGLFLLFGAIAAIVPRSLEPALPVVVLVAAAAVGWSWRDLLPDFVAGLVIAAERRIVPGQWISTPHASGIVEQTTLRVTRIRDATGRHVALPNRTLLRDAVVSDRGRWPTLEIELLIPGSHPPSTVRRVIEDAVLVSPWAAPVPAQMIREEREPGRWRVRARILESRFADRFEGGLREHVEEVLDRGSRLRG